MKRALIIILIVIIVAGLGWLLFVFLHRSPSAGSGAAGTLGSLPPVTSGQSGVNSGSGSGTGSTSAATSTAAKATLTSSDPVLSYFVDDANNAFVVEPSGIVAEVTGGQSTNLSGVAVPNIETASFSYNGQMILVGARSGAATEWSLFNLATKSWTTLSLNATAAAWSPSDSRIAYLSNSTNGAALETLDLSNAKAKPKLITTLTDEDFQVAWDSANSIILSDKSSGLFSGSILSVNATTGAASSIVQNKVGLEVQWNPSATMGVILVGSASARGGQLGIIDSAGDLMHQMNFLTLPSKCAFAAGTSTEPLLICGIPRNATSLQNNLLPDAYNEGTLVTLDDFYQVNLITGATTPVLVDPSLNFDASDATIVNNTYFFINRYDQELYAISPAQQP